MPDGQEEPVDGYVIAALIGLALTVNDVGSLYAVLTEEPQRIGLEENLYLGVLLDALLHDLGCPQIGLAHNQIDLAG